MEDKQCKVVVHFFIESSDKLFKPPLSGALKDDYQLQLE